MCIAYLLSDRKQTCFYFRLTFFIDFLNVYPQILKYLFAFPLDDFLHNLSNANIKNEIQKQKCLYLPFLDDDWIRTNAERVLWISSQSLLQLSR
jgi:hypothetical protein